MEKFKMLSNTLKEMEEMKNKAIEETREERDEKRIENIKEIQEYFKEVQKNVYFPTRWEIVKIVNNIAQYSSHKDTLSFRIEMYGQKEIIIFQSGKDVNIKICNITEKDYLEKTYNGYKMKYEYIQLIEKWDVIKKQFENALERKLFDLMEDCEKEMTQYSESYNKTFNFKV
jgi:hypothetical protein